MLAIFLNKTIMARPTKQGLDYFPLDVDFFQDLKIRKIIRVYGNSAPSILICILCMIYKDNGYYIKWDEDTAFIISEILNSDEEKISLVVSKAIEVDFFNKEVFSKFSILTSRAIQKRFQLIVKNSKLKRSKIEHNLNLLGVNTEEMGKSSEETPITSEETPITSEETPKSSEESTQSKVKESKEKVTHIKKSENFFENFDEVEVEEIPTLETEIPLQKSSAKKVSPIEDVFLNNLSKFQNDYPNTKRFQEICMFNNKPEEFMLKLFDEFIEDNRKSREHATKEDYTYFYQSIDKHFFYWVKAKISKPTTQTKREQQSEIYKAINEGKSITEILGV